METGIPTVGPRERPRDQPVQVETGAGARSLDAIKNDLGVELINMERLEELSSGRRQKGWWLKEKAAGRSWVQTLHADLSLDQDVRLKTIGERNGVLTRVEVGLTSDRRVFSLLEPNQNLFDSSDDVQVQIQRRKDYAYAVLDVRSDRYRGLAEMDSKVENIFAGDLLTGEKSSRENGLGAALLTELGELTPFVQSRWVDFSSRLTPLDSNVTTALKAGIKYQTKGTRWSFEPQLASENFERSFQDQSVRAQFRRTDLSAKVHHEFPLAADVKLKQHLFLQAVRDSAVDYRSDQGAWDVGWNLTGGRERGWLTQLRTYSIRPTPSQLFGDGALLSGSMDLPSVKGTRGSVGLWGKGEQHSWEVSVFTETEADTPVAVAVSPARARTLAIGGLVNRGVDVRGQWSLVGGQIKGQYTFQDTVNSSDVSWQRGHRLPGRPEHVLSLDVTRQRAHWKQGLVYRFQSEDALDLTGLWRRPPQHDLGGYVGYGKKEWEMRLAISQALAALNKLPSAEFAGSAGPSLLEPTLQQSEVRFQCEILL